MDSISLEMTAAGLVIEALDAIPAPAVSVVRSGHRWAVLDVDGPRVTKLRVEAKP